LKTYEQYEKGVGSIRAVEREVPVPGAGEVLVRVGAVSLNYRDLMIARDTYGRPIRYPIVPLSDGAGEVAGVGDGVRAVRKGQKVMGTFFPYWTSGNRTPDTDVRALGGDLGGMLSEYVVLPESGVVPVPDHLTIEEASTLPCAGLTAWNALFGAHPVKPGDTVLVLGTGGVSSFSVLFAKASGARVIVTSRSDEKIARMKSFGSDLAVNTTTFPEWEKRVLELTGGRGADMVIENGGGNSLARSLVAVRTGGTISLIGVLSGIEGTVNTGLILMKSVAVQGIYVGNRQQFLDMNECLRTQGIHPVVDHVYPVSEVSEAYKHLEAGRHVGKLVIRI
jgi:NADPH:quinone reductase-like Zn-dependent oxidoreductase